MMADGFIFDHDRCVNCSACIAACSMENRWSFRPRTVYTVNAAVIPSLPVINISLACNHCLKAICMEGCPTSSYHRDPVSSAVVIDEAKCIGCRYCQWNCPYDAPKYDRSTKVIGKCDLCYKRIAEGFMPACSTACPTGALTFGKIHDIRSDSNPPWFPDKKLEPSVRFKERQKMHPMRIYPAHIFDKRYETHPEEENGTCVEWSLTAFSFLTALSVALIISALLTGTMPEILPVVPLIIIAGVSSLFHLGKKLRAWRAIINIKNSPLSREIGLYIIYGIIATSSVVFQMPGLLIAASVTGLLLLLAIDEVYIYADNRVSVFMHSGQLFLSVLLIAAFLTGKTMPFILVAVVKVSSIIYSIYTTRKNSYIFGIRYFRLALLLITGISLIPGKIYPEKGVIYLFLAGELLDRILFYVDFKPLNLKRSINSYKTGTTDEEKGG